MKIYHLERLTFSKGLGTPDERSKTWGLFRAVPSFANGAIISRPPSEATAQAVPKVAPPETDGSATSTKREDLPERQNHDSRDHDPDKDGAAPSKRADPKPDPEEILAGPTPAFQASLPEIQRDLQVQIARLEAARQHRDDNTATPSTP